MNKYCYKISDDFARSKKLELPIKIINPENGKSLSVIGVIDTGARCCTFPGLIARTLDFPLDEESKNKFGTQGISGEPVTSYKHIVKIEVYDSKRMKVLRSMDIIASFLEKNDIPPLLGVDMFLERFNINIDYIGKQFELKWP